MIKVQDFATKYGVTDRQVQRLLKKYEDEITGHFERKGPNGTWIDETGEKILRSKMRQAPIVLHDSEVGQKLARLEQENEELKNKLIIALEKVQEQQVLLDDDKKSQLMLQAAEEQVKKTARELTEAHQQLGAVRQEVKVLRKLQEQQAKELLNVRALANAKHQESARLQKELEAEKAKIKALEQRSRWKKFLDLFR